MKTDPLRRPDTTRRAASIAVFVCVALAAFAQPACAGEVAGTSVTLLGTGGGPFGRAQRAGIASLVEYGGARYLVDAGEGVVRQLAQAGLDASALSAIFLTHLHDDHTAGLPALLSFSWTRGGKPVPLVGPPRTQALLDGVIAFMEPNVEIRSAERPYARLPRDLYSARELQPSEVWSSGAVRVAVLENTHYHFRPDSAARRNRSYALRFTTPDRTIVFTGDTGPSVELVAFAAGADTIVAELASSADVRNVPGEVRAHMLTEHLSPTEAGLLAKRAGARHLVLSHVGSVPDEDVAEIRRLFDGTVTVGHDLMKF